MGIDGMHLDATRLDTLELLLTQQFDFGFEAKYIQRFRSKKNIVIHLGLRSKHQEEFVSLVAKLFVTGYFENELEILRKCHSGSLSVPQVIGAKNGVILMEFIPGQTLTERVNKTFDSDLINELARWYYKFHNITGVIKEDPRLRNFICNKDTIFGLDFEEAHPGHWITDIGGVSASLLDTNPVFDIRKRVLAWQLLDAYLSLRNLERNPEIDTQFTEKIANTLEKTAYWRQDNSIKSLAEHIRHNGLEIE